MLRVVLLGLCLMVFLPLESRGQTWSSDQQDVWLSVETYWRLYAAEDLEGFLGYLHDDFSGWTNTNALPRSKEDMARYLPLGFESTETLIYDVSPVGIGVFGTVAIVHYYYSRTFLDAAGGQHSEAGRWTDVLQRQGDRWVMIGDHGGSDGGD